MPKERAMNEAPVDGGKDAGNPVKVTTGNPVKVFDAWNSIQAQLLEAELLAAGVKARVASTAIEALAGKVPYQDASCPVWVAAEDETLALEVVRAFERRWAEQKAAAAEPFCYHCGGAVSAGVTSCPHCQGALDWSN
jgi:hypothetical protein